VVLENERTIEQADEYQYFIATETLSMMKKVVVKKFGAKQFRDLLFVTRVLLWKRRTRMLCPKETAPLVPINLGGRILVGSFSLLA
jgi:hypothetical protein